LNDRARAATPAPAGAGWPHLPTWLLPSKKDEKEDTRLEKDKRVFSKAWKSGDWH
jgi:hypothetical protein